MEEFIISSHAYGNAFVPIIKRRLEEHGIACLNVQEGAVLANTSEDNRGELALAAAELIIIDLRPFEMERLIKQMPFSEAEAEAILPRALKLSYRKEDLKEAYVLLNEFLASSRLVVAEGFLRFRMPLMLERWASSADRAGTELLMRREYSELFMLSAAIGKETRRACTEVSLIVFSDSSCTLSDDSGCSIECACIDESFMLSLLRSLSPMKLFVYDLSGEGTDDLLSEVRSYFGDRAVIFRLQMTK